MLLFNMLQMLVWLIYKITCIFFFNNTKQITVCSYEVQCTKMSHLTFTILQLGCIKTAFSTS